MVYVLPTLGLFVVGFLDLLAFGLIASCPASSFKCLSRLKGLPLWILGGGLMLAFVFLGLVWNSMVGIEVIFWTIVTSMCILPSLAISIYEYRRENRLTSDVVVLLFSMASGFSTMVWLLWILLLGAIEIQVL